MIRQMRITLFRERMPQLARVSAASGVVSLGIYSAIASSL